MPAAILNQPELTLIEMHYWIAFNALTTSRQSGMGLGYIPYSEITSYLDDQGIFDFEERDDFRYYITHIDHTFVSIKSEESERKSKQKKK